MGPKCDAKPVEPHTQPFDVAPHLRRVKNQTGSFETG
jgi:hypothetical protein